LDLDSVDVSVRSFPHSVDRFVGDFTSFRWWARRFGWFFLHRVDDVESVVIFVRHSVDDVHPVVMDLDHSVTFVHPFRWFIDPVGFSRRRSVSDVRSFRFVVRPTCCDLDHRRRELWKRRWFLPHSVIAEPPVVTNRCS
jgi:hypothetical protein